MDLDCLSWRWRPTQAKELCLFLKFFVFYFNCIFRMCHLSRVQLFWSIALSCFLLLWTCLEQAGIKVIRSCRLVLSRTVCHMGGSSGNGCQHCDCSSFCLKLKMQFMIYLKISHQILKVQLISILVLSFKARAPCGSGFCIQWALKHR